MNKMHKHTHKKGGGLTFTKTTLVINGEEEHFGVLWSSWSSDYDLKDVSGILSCDTKTDHFFIDSIQIEGRGTFCNVTIEECKKRSWDTEYFWFFKAEEYKPRKKDKNE
jgi:hypothetical protein